jgi:hypothetical protein
MPAGREGHNPPFLYYGGSMDKIEFTIRRAEPSDVEGLHRILQVLMSFGTLQLHFLP